MKIGIDGHDLEGNRTGVGRYLMNILRAWEAQGVYREHQVVIFFKAEIPNDLPDGIVTKLLRPRPLNLLKASNAIFMHSLLPVAAKMAKIDVLFCPSYVAPFLYKKPFVVTLHDIIYEAHPELFRYHSIADTLLLKRASRWTASNASFVLTPSHFTASEVMAHYEIPVNKIVVTPLAPDPRFTPERNADLEKKTLKKFKIINSFLFSIGTIQTRRHIPECMRAFAAAAKDNSNYQYLIAGSNQTDPHVDIEALLETINADLKRRAIIYVPYIENEDLVHLYRATSSLVWLSEYEGFGLPPLEAQASGSPVITSPHASLPEAVGECAAFVVNPEDENEIADAMERLMSDGQYASRLAECGPRHAANFSWDATAAKTLETLLSAAGSS